MKFEKNAQLNKTDPLTKQPEVSIDSDGLSPMNPPDGYSPPKMDFVNFDDFDPFLLELKNHHDRSLDIFNDFENAILSILKEGINQKSNQKVSAFFKFFDEELIPHFKAEERYLFPNLKKKLLETGEHSLAEDKKTPVDVMEMEHLEAIQLAAISLNLYSLSFKLLDQDSKILVLDSALKTAQNLVELLKLHVFRENNILFPLAQKLISEEEFKHLIEVL